MEIGRCRKKVWRWRKKQSFQSCEAQVGAQVGVCPSWSLLDFSLEALCN